MPKWSEAKEWFSFGTFSIPINNSIMFNFKIFLHRPLFVYKKEEIRKERIKGSIRTQARRNWEPKQTEIFSSFFFCCHHKPPIILIKENIQIYNRLEARRKIDIYVNNVNIWQFHFDTHVMSALKINQKFCGDFMTHGYLNCITK